MCREKSGRYGEKRSGEKRSGEKRRGRWGIYTIRQVVEVAGLCTALENREPQP